MPESFWRTLLWENQRHVKVCNLEEQIIQLKSGELVNIGHTWGKITARMDSPQNHQFAVLYWLFGGRTVLLLTRWKHEAFQTTQRPSLQITRSIQRRKWDRLQRTLLTAILPIYLLPILRCTFLREKKNQWNRTSDRDLKIKTLILGDTSSLEQRIT